MHTLFIALILLAPPPFKPWLMRVLLGARIGRNVRMGWFAGISARHIAIGDESDIRALTFIRCHGDVIIGRYSIISSFVLVYGAADLLIGDHSYIGPQTSSIVMKASALATIPHSARAAWSTHTGRSSPIPRDTG